MKQALAPLRQELFRAREMAARAAVSVRTFHRMVAGGDFPKGIMINERCRRWTEEDFQEWVRRHKDRRPA